MNSNPASRIFAASANKQVSQMELDLAFEFGVAYVKSNPGATVNCFLDTAFQALKPGMKESKAWYSGASKAIADSLIVG